MCPAACMAEAGDAFEIELTFSVPTDRMSHTLQLTVHRPASSG